MGRGSKSFLGPLCVNEEQDKSTKRGDRKLSERFSPNSAFINEMMAPLLSAPQMASVRLHSQKHTRHALLELDWPLKRLNEQLKYNTFNSFV